jgi:hypothetical protein
VYVCHQGDLLTYLSPRLLMTLATFRPPSATSTDTLQTGKVQSSFMNADGTTDTQQLHEEWKKIIIEFSQAMVSIYNAHVSTLPLHHFHICSDEPFRSRYISVEHHIYMYAMRTSISRSVVICGPHCAAQILMFGCVVH